MKHKKQSNKNGTQGNMEGERRVPKLFPGQCMSYACRPIYYKHSSNTGTSRSGGKAMPSRKHTQESRHVTGRGPKTAIISRGKLQYSVGLRNGQGELGCKQLRRHSETWIFNLWRQFQEDMGEPSVLKEGAGELSGNQKSSARNYPPPYTPHGGKGGAGNPPPPMDAVPVGGGHSEKKNKFKTREFMKFIGVS